jgi:DNA-binding response OmpR family regulator
MKNILIAEDDLNIAELERDFLKLNGYSAEIATDGTAALQLALTGRFDVLIVDLMLPGTGGYDIIKAVREKFEIPILVVSARSEDIDKIRGLEVGADDYLTKPFSPAELAARVKSHVERYARLRGGGSANVIARKWLEINTRYSCFSPRIRTSCSQKSAFSSRFGATRTRAISRRFPSIYRRFAIKSKKTRAHPS